jgi:hypothetical protein
LNDLGNFSGSFDVEKKWEDLLAWKPSLIWAFVADRFGIQAYSRLLTAVRNLPEPALLQAWVQEYELLHEAKQWVENKFEEATEKFCSASDLSRDDLVPIMTLKERIKNAYV